MALPSCRNRVVVSPIATDTTVALKILLTLHISHPPPRAESDAHKQELRGECMAGRAQISSNRERDG
jgi:hypothetical protein